jgi:hypothetical protein
MEMVSFPTERKADATQHRKPRTGARALGTTYLAPLN